MQNSSALSKSLEQQERSLFLFVVVVGYIVTFTVASNGGTRYTIQQLILGLGFGALYLILGAFDAEILGRFPPGMRNAGFFLVMIAMVLGIGWTLGPGGNWLIGLPLAGIAVERLAGRGRWLVYAGLLGAVILPIARYSTWSAAFMNAFIISTAIFFVALITQFRLNEQKAREHAEGLALQLETANRKLAEYASQAEELAAAQERNRLAREIHDSLGHYLTVASVQIEAAKVTLASNPQRARTALENAHDIVRQGLSSVRDSISALRTMPLENRSLTDAIAALAAETRASGLEVQFRVQGEARTVCEPGALALYRAAQEGLTNIHKHARASRVDLELDFSAPDRICLLVDDNGIGASDTGGGFGLIGIRERIHLLGGECTIRTQVGEGFSLKISIPDTAEERG